jgi:shikimate kinase
MRLFIFLNFLTSVVCFRNIILIGMPDSGKTFLGKQLSKKLQLPFYDSDDSNPFLNVLKTTKKNWNMFRAEESKIIHNWMNDDTPKILSTGGGCIENAYLFNCLLNKPNQDVIIHIIGNKTSNKNLPNTRENLWNKRAKWYFLLSDFDYVNDYTDFQNFLDWFEISCK